MGGGGNFNMSKSKEAANRFLLVLLIIFSDVGELHVILISLLLFFFFNLQVFAIDYYHAISPWD